MVASGPMLKLKETDKERVDIRISHIITVDAKVKKD